MTAGPVEFSAAGGVGWIGIDNPPVNALSHAVREGLRDALAEALRSPEVRAIVIRARGRTWPAGADIREFGAPPAAPVLPEICTAVAASSKPVVALIHGTALGGGLELALAARARLALPGTSLGLPEVTLGFCPGAGGTQRLPRLVGPRAALGLILTGLPVAAERAAGMGLIDGIVGEAEAAEVAAALALSLVDAPAARPDTPGAREAADAGAWMAAVAEARAGLKDRRLPAPAKIIDCVEAALLLPEEAGLAFERAAFLDLLETPESRALRHVFLAERRAPKHPALAAAPKAGADRVALLDGMAGQEGGGAGAELAAALAMGGAEVTIVSGDRDRAEAAAAVACARIGARAERGRITLAAAEAAAARIASAAAGPDLAAIGDAEVAVVAGGAWPALAARLPEGALAVLGGPGAQALALDAGSPLAGRAAGFVLPDRGGAARLVEIVAPPSLPPALRARAAALARRLGRTPIWTGGHVVQSLREALFAAADLAVELGAGPYEVDRALTAWGFHEGPFLMRDREGLDTAPLPEQGSVAERLWLSILEEGGTGVETEAGFYTHAGGSPAERPDMAALMSAARTAAGNLPVPVDPATIVRIAVGAMANAGARLLETGGAARPSDVDIAAVHGIGLARWRGGPMFAADLEGPLQMRNLLRGIAEDAGEAWAPAAFWDGLIREGRRFADLAGD